MPLTIEYDEKGQMKSLKEISQAELDYQQMQFMKASRIAEEKMHKERKIEEC